MRYLRKAYTWVTLHNTWWYWCKKGHLNSCWWNYLGVTIGRRYRRIHCWRMRVLITFVWMWWWMSWGEETPKPMAYTCHCWWGHPSGHPFTNWWGASWRRLTLSPTITNFWTSSISMCRRGSSDIIHYNCPSGLFYQSWFRQNPFPNPVSRCWGGDRSTFYWVSFSHWIG